MRSIILAALSLLVLTSCSKYQDDYEWDRSTAIKRDQRYLDNVFREQERRRSRFLPKRTEPMKRYTNSIYKHSREPLAVVSPEIVNACMIGPDGIDRGDFRDLIRKDRERAKRCWRKLLTYPKADKRFTKPNTPERNAWDEFIIREDFYILMFDN
ncbi:MAG: hypothetical protein GY793_06195 [Proteobacteria bacterium]|nr:hypothetical protein [Pseudomonadota bacterium]